MPSTREPTVRASHLQDDLQAIDQLGPGAAEVRARLRPATVALIDQTHRTAYLPAELNAELAEAVHAQLGAEGLRRWGQASFLHSLDGFFRPLFQGVTRMLSPSPGLILKTFPQGWLTTYHYCGTFEVTDAGAGATRLTVRDLPPVLRGTAYLTAVCGTLQSIYSFTRFEGEVTLEPRELDSPVASWLVTWRPTG